MKKDFFKDKTFYKIINEISEEENIKCTYLSKNWVIQLEKENNIKFICGYKFGLNDHAIGNIIDDKYALYCVLKENNIPVAEYEIIYNFENNNDYAIGNSRYDVVKKYFYNHDMNVVLKQNAGTCGKDVYHIKDEGTLSKITYALLDKYTSISISPYYEIKSEYRVIVLENEAVLVYEKIRPIVYGDGNKTIDELLREFNLNYFKNRNIDDKILKENEKYEYTWKFNLSQGSICNLKISEEIKNKVIPIAILSARTIGLNFGSVDIIQTNKDEFLVLEINSGVMMDNFINIAPNGYSIAKSIYKKAIQSLMK